MPKEINKSNFELCTSRPVHIHRPQTEEVEEKRKFALIDSNSKRFSIYGDNTRACRVYIRVKIGDD